jgi:hypothetical protein
MGVLCDVSWLSQRSTGDEPGCGRVAILRIMQEFGEFVLLPVQSASSLTQFEQGN